MTINQARLFVGPKTTCAVPVRCALHRDFLIQSTLDGCVRRIEYHPALRVDDGIVRVDALVVDSDDGRHAIDFADARPACDPMAEHLMHLSFSESCSGIMVVADADIRREPRFSSARAVWSHRDTRISTDDRVEVLNALENEGPLPLRSLYGLAATSRDVTDVVYALACGGELEIDLRRALDDRTIVRLGSRSRFQSSRLSYGT